MPELPEVETIARELRGSPLIGRAVVDAQFFWHKTLATPPAAAFVQALRGQRLRAVGRRGKYLVLQFDEETVLIHLRMSGKLALVSAADAVDPYERARLVFEKGLALQFCDTRKFGRWYLERHCGAKLAALGPEPLDEAFGAEALLAALQGSARPLKALLLDQSAVAGLGNIYVDEALWEARLHPQRRACGVSGEEAVALCAAIKKVLLKGIANSGTRLGRGRASYYSVYRRAGNEDQLNVFRRHGEGCPRCGAVIERIKVAQRSTHFCPRCQRG